MSKTGQACEELLVNATENAVLRLANYLADQQCNNGEFPGRTFYGLAFAILLWSRWPKIFSNHINQGLDWYERNPSEDLEAHHEFMNYALLHYFRRTGDSRGQTLCIPLQFRGKRNANWRLLRAACHLLADRTGGEDKARHEIRKVLSRQVLGGQVIDAPQSYSLQYHHFSALLLGELAVLLDDDVLQHRFLDLAAFSRDTILPNGDAVYMGRGQHQIFGYAAAVSLLFLASFATADESFQQARNVVLRRLLPFQRPDGSFPLVLRVEESGWPSSTPPLTPQWLGWYQYNNIFDYLPFAGEMLARSAGSTINTCKTNTQDLHEPDRLIVRSRQYTAVVATPRGFRTNGLPTPYIATHRGSLIPSCGGEDGNPLYKSDAIPLPFGRPSEPVPEPGAWLRNASLEIQTGLLNLACWIREGRFNFHRVMDLVRRHVSSETSVYAFGDKLIYRLRGQLLTGRSRHFIHTRHFAFEDNTVVVDDRIRVRRSRRWHHLTVQNHIFFTLRYQPSPNSIENTTFFTSKDGTEARVQFSHPVVVSNEPLFCATGRVVAARETLPGERVVRGVEFLRSMRIELVGSD